MPQLLYPTSFFLASTAPASHLDQPLGMFLGEIWTTFQEE
jgi:hypothetical protein